MNTFCVENVILKIVKCLLVLQIFLAIHLFAIEDGSGPAEKLVLRKERFKNWYEMAYVPLKGPNGRLIDLNLKNRIREKADIVLSTKQQFALRELINRNLETICAKDFDDYYKSLKKIARGDLKIHPSGYGRLRYWLKDGDAIRRPELLSDYELVEAYWMLCSQAGYSNIHFVGLITDESFYQVKEIYRRAEFEAAPDPFPEDRKAGGQALQLSSFVFSGSESNIEFERKGQILIVDIRYMFKTNIKNLAYPICIRAYWNEGLEEWIPWFCLEYNAAERYCRVAF